ncbi:HlyD family secretion protein [Sandarakinorhabdus sp.]|jgi:HlyD family secretion protein|uniref:HlyD family secretion protein n=1 Tax=Sandarakinorhabdus sp. TaxID=1916663 RepID=UPI0028A73341|nr:HlyD family efflux transporter periplasmic adaptor subunit [Sandarakinorhabdus sp.]
MPSSAAERAIAALALLALAGCQAGEAATPVAPRHVASAQGRLDAASETRWLAAEIDARISGVPVMEGQRVRAGDMLVKLACTDREAAAAGAAARARAVAAEARLVAAGPRAEVRDEVQARLAAADADLQDARDQDARARALLAGGWISPRRIEQVAAGLEAAVARRAAAAAALAAVDAGARPDERAAAAALAAAANATARQSAADADRCLIRAPIAGTVLRILRHEGEFSGAGSASPLIAIADVSRLMVRAEVLDRDAARVRPGMIADVWLDEQPGRWTGRVIDGAGLVGRRTARSLDPADRFDRDIREVRVQLDGRAPPALVGLRVNVGFRGDGR